MATQRMKDRASKFALLIEEMGTASFAGLLGAVTGFLADGMDEQKALPDVYDTALDEAVAEVDEFREKYSGILIDLGRDLSSLRQYLLTVAHE